MNKCILSNGTVNQTYTDSLAKFIIHTGGKLEMTVSKGIYIALCLFLGGLGLHKFYAGKWIQGLLYLAFCWTGVPVVLSLIDLLISIFKQPDGYGQIEF